MTPLEAKPEALSPFLDGTNIQFAWDSTSLGWAKTCPRLYYYNMIECYRPKDESIHLRFGREYQKALEEYDIWRAAGITHDEAEHEVVDQLMARTKDYVDPPTGTRSVLLKTKANLVRTVIWHLEQFKDDPAKTFILKDGSPAVELSFRFQLDFGPTASQEEEAICRAREQGNFNEVPQINQPYLLCGHLDRVVEFNDEIFVIDHKTTASTIGTNYFDQYEPNNQMTLYTLAGQVVLKSTIKGVIIDAAQILVDSSRFVRSITYRTPDQLEEWLEDLHYHLRVMETYATEGYWPQNDTACDKYGGCRFREVCSKSPKVRENFLKSDFTQEQAWNPLEVR